MTVALAFDSLGLRRAIVEWYAPDTARGVNQTFSLLDVAQDNAHDLLLLQLACRARGPALQLRRPARRPLVLPRRRPIRATDAHDTRTTG